MYWPDIYGTPAVDFDIIHALRQIDFTKVSSNFVKTVLKFLLNESLCIAVARVKSVGFSPKEEKRKLFSLVEDQV